MSYRLNKAYIREYAAEVAQIICKEFYQQNTQIEGKHLVNLTEIRQVNLFLVKKMYLRWQEEGAALHSPYFNYSAPEVRLIFNKLMNVLSKNISITQSDFEPFLASSIRETLYFLIDPTVYFEGLLDGFSGKIYVKSQVLPLKKYYRYHFPLIEKYFDALEEEANKVKTKKAVKVLNKCMDKYPALLSNTSEVVSEFERYKPFILDKAYIKEDDVEEEQPEFSDKDFDLKAEQEEITEQQQSNSASKEVFEYEDFSNEEEKLGTVNEEVKVSDKVKLEKEVADEEKVEEIVEQVDNEVDKVEHVTEKVEETPAFKEPEVKKKEPSSWGEAEKMLGTKKEETTPEEEKIPAVEDKDEESTPLEQVLESEEEEDSGFNDFMIRDDIEEEATGVTKASVPDSLDEEENRSTGDEEETPKTLLEKLQKDKPKEVVDQTKNSLFSADEEDEDADESTSFTTIQEKLKQGQETQSRKSLKGNIPLNMKMRYKKVLFGDDQTEFESAIDMIDDCSDYHEAIKLLKENYVTKYNWDFSEESTRDFLSMVDNNFN
jgi:hypothetical protein